MTLIALLLITSTTYAASIDCPNMIQLAFGLGMQTAQPAIWTALQSDCCNTGATRVSCNGSQRVWQINWYTMGLNGVINGTAIPSSVTYLSLNGNAITGSIPLSLPSGLVLLYLHGNQMSGDLPPFPSTLQYLYLGYPGWPGNRFTGSLGLNIPSQLYIHDNWITDVVVQDSSVLNPSYCDLSNNPLLGNPNIVGLTMCTKNGLYSAALLPLTRSTTTVAKTTTTSAVILMSVLETATQFGSSEMTSAVAIYLATVFEFPTTTMTTMKAMHLTINGITSTQTTTLGWTSIAVGTTQFAPMMRVFAFTLFMVVRALISGMLLTYVIRKAPFKREFKKMMRKRKTVARAPEF